MSAKGRTTSDLAVGASSARHLQAGHPWVRVDRHTGSTRGLKAGEVVRLVDPRGRALGWALAEPGADICARRIASAEHPALDAAGWSAEWTRRAGHAIELRDRLVPADTTLLRLVHGEADGLPGLTVDRLGELLLLTTRCEAAVPLVLAVRAALVARFPSLCLYWRRHHRDLRRGRPDAALPGEFLVGEVDREAPVIGREAGLEYLVRPFGGLSIGFYPDQRDNRAAIARLAAGGSLLNLFAHTGAFSVAAVAAGAARVVSVDRSGRYLRWLEENLARNGFGVAPQAVAPQAVAPQAVAPQAVAPQAVAPQAVAPQAVAPQAVAPQAVAHQAVEADALEWLRGGSDTFDVIVVDPPTFSGGGKDRWSAKGDLPALLQAVCRRLSPGGALLVCSNARRIEEAELRSRVLAGLGPGRRAHWMRAGPGVDHPVLMGFSEGEQHRAVLARTAGDARAPQGRRAYR